jgi:hypothetical protein
MSIEGYNDIMDDGEEFVKIIISNDSFLKNIQT